MFSPKGMLAIIFVTVGSGQNSSGSFHYAHSGQNGIQYQLFSNQDRQFPLRTIPNITRAEDVIQGVFNVGSSDQNQHRIFVWVPPFQQLSPGTYKDQFELKAYPGKYHNNVAETPLFTTMVSIEIVVDEIMEIAIGNGEFAKTGRINFGIEELAEDQLLQYDIRVRSNRDYNLLFNSENQGYLAHENPRAGTKIQYFLKLDDRDVSIHTRLPRECHANPEPLAKCK